MDDAQAERSGNGGINAGPLFAQNVKAQRRAAGHIRHHRGLIIHLGRTEETKIRKSSVLLGKKSIENVPYFHLFYLPSSKTHK